MEAKLSAQTDEYWLKAEAKEDNIAMQVFIFHNEQVKQKMSRELNLRKDLKDLRILKSPMELLQILKNPANYEINAKERLLILKWAITAQDYSFCVNS